MSSLTTKAQSLIILSGFIRNIETLLSFKDNLFQIIPQSIIDLIALFVDDLFSNQGSHTWKIKDPLTVDRILHAKNMQKFTSDPFIISRLKYQLEIYPNGDKPELIGYFVIYLRVLSLPKYIKNVSIGRTFKILENKAGAAYHCAVSLDEHEYWGRKCPLSELLDINPDTISVKVEIIINKILLNDTSILDNYPLRPTTLNQLKSEYHLKYTYNQATMDIIRNNKSDMIKEICSGLLDDMWHICIYPNGDDDQSKGQLSVYFGFCRWPRNVKYISLEYKIYDSADTILVVNQQMILVRIRMQHLQLVLIIFVHWKL